MPVKDMAAYKRKRRAAFRAKGLCIECGKVNPNGNTLCPTCMDKHTVIVKRKELRLVKEGLCPKCGKERPVGANHCRDCLAKRRANPTDPEKNRKGNLAARMRYAEAGLCACGHERDDPDRVKCITCRLGSREPVIYGRGNKKSFDNKPKTEEALCK